MPRPRQSRRRGAEKGRFRNASVALPNTELANQPLPPLLEREQISGVVALARVFSRVMLQGATLRAGGETTDSSAERWVGQTDAKGRRIRWPVLPALGQFQDGARPKRRA